MRTSLTQLKTNFINGVLRFLWRQWSQLGVAGEVEFRDRWLIDPEALLFFTLEMGRYDPRLFDEVLDWCLRNGRWLSIQRLKNIACDLPTPTQQLAVLAGFAEFMSEREGTSRWRALTSISGAHSDPAFPLFLNPEGGYLPILSATEPTFAKHAVQRPPVRIRGMSRPVPMDVSTNLLFKFRALFGLGARPEVIVYLLRHSEGYPSEIARATHYAQSSVAVILDDLAQSKTISVRELNNMQLYHIDKTAWSGFLRIVAGKPRWIDWDPVLTGLSAVNYFLAEDELQQASQYILQSRARSLWEDLTRLLSGTGFVILPAVPTIGAALLPAGPNPLESIIVRLIRALNSRPRGMPLTPQPVVPRAVKRPFSGLR